MIEGMQIIVMYPLLKIDGPANLGMMQAVMRKISTFEMVDGDIIKEIIWKFDGKENLDYYF